MFNKKIIISVLLANVVFITSLTGCNKEPTATDDTIRWFNGSHAILTDINGDDYNIFSGMEPTEENKEITIRSLDEWWNITDKVSADETINWLIDEGHSLDFASLMKQLDEFNLSEFAEDQRSNIIFETYDLTESNANALASSYNDYIIYGESAIDGWDYTRALSLLGWFYIADYYTKEEALDKSLEIALLIQSQFSSWDDLITSYLIGYSYWSEESSDERRAIYDEIKTREDSPYLLDFDLELKKSW